MHEGCNARDLPKHMRSSTLKHGRMVQQKRLWYWCDWNNREVIDIRTNNMLSSRNSHRFDVCVDAGWNDQQRAVGVHIFCFRQTIKMSYINYPTPVAVPKVCLLTMSTCLQVSWIPGDFYHQYWRLPTIQSVCPATTSTCHVIVLSIKPATSTVRRIWNCSLTAISYRSHAHRGDHRLAWSFSFPRAHPRAIGTNLHNHNWTNL